MPKRSAVVAFSLAEVYAIAERLRVRKGGAAVVAGALSPRTRNAQVALFQEGAVDYLVATDAIGMGLNLDVAHVAFASLRKFDGRDVRALDVAETSQIAGRAGRHLRDGTFGTVRPALLPEDVVLAVEQHRVTPIRRVLWRSNDLAFGSTRELLASLQVPPSRPRLRAAAVADDQRALEALLARDPDLGRGHVRLLWDVCKIPDFRKLLFEHHVRFLAELYDELRAHDGLVREDWLATRVDALDHVDGEVDDLTARIAEIRLYTYVANQGSWVQHADDWRARTTALEDRLSDALHEKLVQRFVTGRPGSTRQGRTRAARRGEQPASVAVDPHGPFAALLPLRRALRDASLDSTPNLTTDDVDWLLAQDPAALELGPHGALSLSGRQVGFARRGLTLDAPGVALDLDVGQQEDRALAERFLQRAVQSGTAARFPALYTEGDTPALRGLRFALRRGLGVTRREGLALDASLPLVVGARWIWLEQRDEAWVARLLAVAYGREPPATGGRAIRVTSRAPRAFWETAGLARVGGYALPIPLAESVLRAERSAAEALARRSGVVGDVGVFLDDLRDDVAPDDP